MSPRVIPSWTAIGLLLACVPLRELDDAVGGPSAFTGGAGAAIEGGTTGTGGAAAETGGANGDGGLAEAGSGNTAGKAASVTGGWTGCCEEMNLGGSEGGGPAGGDSATPGTGGTPAEGGRAAAAGSAGSAGSAGDPDGTPQAVGGSPPIVTQPTDAPDLPLDLLNSPVSGTFKVSPEMTWEIDGVQESTFHIQTPTASYWLVKSLGVVVSLVDAHPSDPRQWIDYGPSRPLRGFPSYATLGKQERMQTTLDVVSQTLTHARFFSRSESGSTRMTWDFYPTHVTMTINAAPIPYGFAYRGVAAGLLDERDRVVFANEKSQSANLSILADFAGHVARPGVSLRPAEWAYLTDEARDRSLFVIQHTDDEIADRYQVKDGDSSLFSFGDGSLTTLPLRFSVGIIPSDIFPFVRDRVELVISAMQ